MRHVVPPVSLKYEQKYRGPHSIGNRNEIYSECRDHSQDRKEQKKGIVSWMKSEKAKNKRRGVADVKAGRSESSPIFVPTGRRQRARQGRGCPAAPRAQLFLFPQQRSHRDKNEFLSLYITNMYFQAQ